jgi:multidrug efflux system membrane fusion protein
MSSTDPRTDYSATPSVPRRHRWLGAILTLLLIAALAGAAWWLVQRSQKPTAAAQGGGFRGGPGGPGGGAASGGLSATVGEATAQQGQLPVLIEALGTVTPVTQVAVHPQVTGIMTEVLFTEGQMVRKDQLLARIDPAPFEAALAQAQGQRVRDEAQLAAARVTLGRYQQLWQQDSVARQDLDTQAALVQQLEGTVQSDKAAENSARINLGYTRITAPIGGLIGLRAVDPGNMVTAGTTTAIATITQMAPIDVKFAVPQDRVPDVIKAQRGGALPVQALDRARNEVLASGKFLTLDNVIDTATGTLLGKARFGNGDGQLFPNQFVNARLQLGVTPGVLVPVTAVRTGPDGDYVYVIDADSVAHIRLVKRGLASAEQILITQGLAAGEMVVSEGGDRVKDGAPVRRADAAAPPAGGASQARQAASGAHHSSANLPPEVRAKLQGMSPDERRAYMQQLRQQRAAQGASAPVPAASAASAAQR